MLELLFHDAETLHGSCVKSNFTFFFDSIVDQEFIDGVSHPCVSTAVVLLVQLIAILLGILLLHGERSLLAGVDQKEGDAKHEEYDAGDSHGSDESLSCGEVTVLPNDVGGFTGSLDVDLTSEEGSVVSIVFHLDGFIVQVGAAFAFLCLEGHEAGYWSLHFVKKLLRVGESGLHLFMELLVSFPLFLSNILSSTSQIVDDLCVVESEGDNSNLNRHNVSFRAIDSKRWKLCQPRLHFVFDISSKLPYF